MRRASLTFATIACLALLGGCASYQQDSHGFNASQIDGFVTLNQTTVDDVRALFGTPTFLGTTLEDEKTVIGYAFVGNNAGANFLKNWGKGALTLGFGARTYDFTVKNVYFKFDNQNRVTEVKKKGYAYLTKYRFTLWNECEVALTDTEINSSVHYSGKAICDRYAKDAAKTKGIDEKDVDRGEEFAFCNIPCHAIRGALEIFGKFKNYTDDVEKAEGDGSRANEVFGKDRLKNQ